jgi:hypothetical protein
MSVVGAKAEQTEIALVNITRANIWWNPRGTGA